MKLSIAIAEDDPLLRNSLEEKLSFFTDLKIKFVAGDGQELLNCFEGNHNIDVVLMDIQMPGMDGIKATELLKKKHPQVKVIMLTVMDDDQYIFKAIVNGADGYLLKEISPDELYVRILEIMEGGAPMSPAIANRALKLLSKASLPHVSEGSDIVLTPREKEILQQLSTGLDYKRIAENLFISSATVRKHQENIYRKLQVHNKVEAVQKASREGLL